MYKLLILLSLIYLPQVSYSYQCRDVLSSKEHQISLHTADSQIQTSDSLLSGVPNTYQAFKALHLKSAAKARLLTNRDIESINFFEPDGLQIGLSDQIRIGTSGRKSSYISCGTCSLMLSNNLFSFILPMMNVMGKISPEEYRERNPLRDLTDGKFSFVFLNGSFVGVVKALGSETYYVDSDGFFKYNKGSKNTDISTPTFLAVKDLVNSHGDRVLKAGGVYYISKSFYKNSFLPSINTQGPFTNDEPQHLRYPEERYSFDNPVKSFFDRFSFGKIETDNLDLFPQTFLMNAVGVDKNSRLLDWAFPIANASEDSSLNYQMQWEELLKTLSLISSYVQEAHDQNPNFNLGLQP